MYLGLQAVPFLGTLGPKNILDGHTNPYGNGLICVALNPTWTLEGLLFLLLVSLCFLKQVGYIWGPGIP